MARTSYLLKRGATYSFRIAIPKSLQPKLRAKELVRSLHTNHLYEAKERSTILLSSVQELFRIISMSHNFTLEEIQEITRKYFHEVIYPSYEQWREGTRNANRFAVMPSSQREEHPKAPTVEQVVDRIIHPNGYPEGDFLFTMANAVLKRYDIFMNPNSNAYKELSVQGMWHIREEITHLVREYANHNPSPPIQSGWLQAQAPKQVEQSMTMSELFDKYHQINGDSYQLSMKQTHDTALAFWKDVFGDTPIGEVDKAKAVECEVALSKMPKNWTKAKAYRDKKVRELLELSIPKEDRSSPKTINDRIAVYSKLFEWAGSRGHYKAENPFKGLGVAYSAQAKELRLPYSTQQLNFIFSSPVYTGCKSEGRRSQAGEIIIWDGLYWVPLIALLTGARMNEICQLHLTDIRQEQDVWVLDINTEGEDKKVKTKAGKRLVPIHPKLIELGLLDYKNLISKREETRLFPDIHMGDRESYAEKFTRIYAQYILGVKLERDSRHTFHSFRHNATDELRRRGIRMDISKAIIGHEDKDVHARYGGDILQPMKAAIESMSYDLNWELMMKGKESAKLRERF